MLVRHFFSKHLAQVAAIDTAIGQKFVERAEMQNLCHTEHQRLIALFMNDQQQATRALQRDPQQLARELSVNSAFSLGNIRELEARLAAAPLTQQNQIIKGKFEQAAAVALGALAGYMSCTVRSLAGTSWRPRGWPLVHPWRIPKVHNKGGHNLNIWCAHGEPHVNQIWPTGVHI